MFFQDKTIDGHGRALWRRYCNLPADRKRDLTSVLGFVRQGGLREAEVTLGAAGRFRSFDCVVINAPGFNILLPCESSYDLLMQWANPILGADDCLDQMEWFYPAYLTKRFVSEVKRIVNANEPNWKEVFETVLSIVYTPDYLAAMISDRYRAIPAINSQIYLIEESVEAFHFGLTSVAIASLIPVVEGALFRLLLLFCNRHNQTGEKLVEQVMNSAIENATRNIVYPRSWIPDEYRERSFLRRMDEYVEMLEKFKEFCSRYFFAKTVKYKGDARLNRHGILHSVITDYGTVANFYRLVSILDFLAFVGSMNIQGISCLAPDDTDQSRSLASRYKRLIFLGASYRVLVSRRIVN